MKVQQLTHHAPVETSVKVEFTKAEKVAIGRASTPRWEIDVAGYSGARNDVVDVECKPYLDSPGVVFSNGALDPPQRSELFSEPKTRRVVLGRLGKQLVASGRCAPGVKVRLGMATGRISSRTDRAATRALFDAEGWLLSCDCEVTWGGEFARIPRAVSAHCLPQLVFLAPPIGGAMRWTNGAPSNYKEKVACAR